jgi:chromate transporter
MAVPSAEPRPFVPGRPESLGDLFWSFTWLALQGFGGVLAVVQRELVDRKKWLTRDEFVEDWAVAQILPGPNVVNLSLMLGDRYFGIRGALVALAGMLAFPLMAVLLLAVLFAGIANAPAAQGALRGMGAVVAGLILATGLKLMPALKKNVMGVIVCAALGVLTFIAIALMRIPLVWVLLCLGGAGGVWSWHQLGRVGVAIAK